MRHAQGRTPHAGVRSAYPAEVGDASPPPYDLRHTGSCRGREPGRKAPLRWAVSVRNACRAGCHTRDIRKRLEAERKPRRDMRGGVNADDHHTRVMAAAAVGGCQGAAATTITLVGADLRWQQIATSIATRKKAPPARRGQDQESEGWGDRFSQLCRPGSAPNIPFEGRDDQGASAGRAAGRMSRELYRPASPRR